MYTPFLALLPIVAIALPALAAPSQSASLAGRGDALKHGDIGRRGRHDGIRKRACKARTSSLSSSTTASASSLGLDAQATGTVSASPIVSSAIMAATAEIVNTSSADAAISAYSASSSSVSITTSAAVASASAAASSSTSSNATASVDAKAVLTPNGIKAGMTLCTGIDDFSGKLGWCYDWTPSPSAPSGMIGVPMLWGDGSSSDENDASRFAAFKALTTSPAYIIGFEEPDCSTSGSADMSVESSASTWNELIAPHGAEGSLLISPSMCHQAAETFLTPFKQLITTDWDVTNLHINKKDMDGVKADLDYYWNTYNKPMWVTEFACVEDQSWTPCTDQTEIDQFISDIVKLFEEDSRVYAYAYSNGEGLGDAWPAIANGQLTASGQAYLSAVSLYH